MKKFSLKGMAIAAMLLGTGFTAANAQIVINEIWNGSGTDEFVEFHNPTGSAVDVSGWTLVRRTNSGTSDATIYTFPGSTSIAAGGYYVIADVGAAVTPNATYTNVISTGNQSIALKNAGATVVDGVGVGTGTLGVGTLFYSEGTTFAAGIASGTGIERSPNATDTGNNATDFASFSGFANSTPAASNDTPPPGPTVVANIAAARALTVGTVVQISGTVVVNSQTGVNTVARNQFAVQDSSGADGQTAIFIDDPSNVAAAAVVPGSTITNLTGSLSLFNGLLQLTPTAAITVGTPVAAPTPLVLTSGVTVLNDVEAELVTINNADVAETGNWTLSTSYALTAPAGLVVSTVRIGAITGNDLLTSAIPAAGFNVTGIVIESSTVGQIAPRNAADIVPVSNINDWMNY